MAQGFALAAALFALVVVGALAAAALFAALQESRLGRNARAAEAAFDAAEAGLDSALAEGRAGRWGGLAPGDSAALSGAWPAGGGRFDVSVVRLSGRLFLVRSTGADASGAAEDRLGVVARLGAAAVRTPAALAAGEGAVTLEGPALLDGRDADPPGWTGCPPAGRDTVAGLAVPDTSAIAAGPGCAGLACLHGDPPLLEDPSLRDSVPFRLGASGFDELAARATLVHPAGGSPPALTPAPAGDASSCDRSDPLNWGEPARPTGVAGCAGYFPIILAEGDLTLAGGRGQGVLVVRGDLTLTGDALFAGAVLVGGSLRVTGAGGRVFGGIAAGLGGGGTAVALEGGSVVHSACALALAGAVAGPVRALPERSWSRLHQ